MVKSRGAKIARHSRLPIVMLVAVLVIGSSATDTTGDRIRCGPVSSPTSRSETIPRSPLPSAIQHRRDKRDDGGHVTANNRSTLVDDGREVVAIQRLLLRATSAATKFLPFVTSAHPSSRCFKHTVMYLTQLNDFKLWATKSERTYGYVRIVILFCTCT